MKNTIKISTTFSFKGEVFEPSLIIDLDQLIITGSTMPDLHQTLAIQNNIDTYSYAYEVMQESKLKYSDATGLACHCLSDDDFDLPLFIQKHNDSEFQIQLQQIAKDTLGIDNLLENPDIHNALIRAYQLGVDSK